MLRHMTLQTIKLYAKKFGSTHGQIYIACDNSSWRKQYYEYYKANRATTREASPLDWEELFTWLNNIREELDEHMPFHVIHTEAAEADDIIGVLAQRSQEVDGGPLGLGGEPEKVMIVSSDKDFLQLQKYPNVSQFSSIQKKMLNEKDPAKYLFEHIMRGDGGDGVPNVYADDDTLVNTDKRQPPVYQKKLDAMFPEWKKSGNVPDDIKRNFQRNQLMIDLDYIPADVKARILEDIIAAEAKKLPNVNDVMNYLIAKRCTKLMGAINEFYIK